MANIKISALPAAAALTGTEAVPVVQSGVTVKTTAAAIAATGTTPTLNLVTTAGNSTTASIVFKASGSGSTAFVSNSTGNWLSLNGVAEVVPAGGIAPVTTTTYALGSTSFRWAKLWSYDADLSGALAVSGNVTPALLTASKPVFTDASKNLVSTGTLAYDQGGTGQTTYAAGDIVYASATNTLTKLPVGTNGQVLKVTAGLLPAWGTDSAGTGDVVGPASSTDNAIARFDTTTGKLIQNSAVTIADTTGDIVGTATQGVFNTVSTTVNAFGAATTLNMGAATGTATVSNAILSTKAVNATSASATALAVGLNGATNPAFTVDASTASQAAGLKVTGAATLGTVAVAVTDSGANASLTVDAKGTGTIGIGSVSTGAVTITPATTLASTLAVNGATLSTTSASFTALAGATTLLTLGGTGASAVLAVPGTLEQSATTGALTVAGGVYIAKKLTAVGAVATGALTATGAVTASGGVDKLTSASGVVSVAAATAPSTGQVLMATGATTATWQTPASGGSPGGTTTQLQYNNAGSFGGISGVTTDGTRLKASTTIAVGGATPSTSGSGITFPATQDASTNANTLDDYEEGTWTPAVSSLGNLTGTPSYLSTLYTKIGNKCFMEAGVNGLSVTVANTRTNFTVNFPFSAVSAFAVSGTAISNNASGLGGFLGTNTAFSTIYWETGTIIPSGAQSFQIGAWITTA